MRRAAGGGRLVTGAHLVGRCAGPPIHGSQERGSHPERQQALRRRRGGFQKMTVALGATLPPRPAAKALAEAQEDEQGLDDWRVRQQRPG